MEDNGFAKWKGLIFLITESHPDYPEFPFDSTWHSSAPAGFILFVCLAQVLRYGIYFPLRTSLANIVQKISEIIKIPTPEPKIKKTFPFLFLTILSFIT